MRRKPVSGMRVKNALCIATTEKKLNRFESDAQIDICHARSLSRMTIFRSILSHEVRNVFVVAETMHSTP